MADKYIVKVNDDSGKGKIVTVDANTKTDAAVKAAQKVGSEGMTVESITKRDGDAWHEEVQH